MTMSLEDDDYEDDGREGGKWRKRKLGGRRRRSFAELETRIIIHYIPRRESQAKSEPRRTRTKNNNASAAPRDITFSSLGTVFACARTAFVCRKRSHGVEGFGARVRVVHI